MQASTSDPRPPRPRPPRPRPSGELHLYYALVGAYFFAFGMQAVLFPSLAAFALAEGGAGVGAAQMAISLPMFLLLLVGGQLAERSQAGPTLAWLQVMFAVPPILLAIALARDALNLMTLLAYGATMGGLAAFMLPVRDAALNGVVARAAGAGARVGLSSAAMTTTAVQIAAQIAGILTARVVDFNAGQAISAAPFLIAQSVAVAIGAALALRLRAPKPERAPRGLRQAVRDIGDGLSYAFKDRILAPMLWSSAYVGVFIVGSFQVLFPLIVRESYAGGPSELGLLFAIFWSASFVSAVAMSRLGAHVPPGPALLASHALGAAALLSFAIDKPFWLFQVIVALWGLGAGVAMTMSRTIVQSAAAPAYLGRVLAVYSMGFMGGAPLGAILVGVGADLLGARGAALIPAFGLAAAALALALFTPIRSLTKAPGPADGAI